MKKILLFIATSLATLTASAQIPTSGLIGYWSFSGNANDGSGNNNNGTVSGVTLITDRFGAANSSYAFAGTTGSGTTNYIKVANSSSFNTEIWSVSAWYKTSATGYGRITTKQEVSTGHTNYMSIFMLNGKVLGSAWNGSTQITVEDTDTTNNNVWHHVVYIRDKVAGKYYLYVDNVLKATTNDTFGNLANTDSLRIGSTFNWQQYNQTWNGSLDDIRIYNRVLNTTEINSLFYENVCVQSLAVTDTLKIKLNATGFNPITYNNEIKIYPNPAVDQLNIVISNYNSINGYQLKITNTLNQTMYQQTITGATYTASLTGYSAGTYIVQVLDGNGNLVDTKKLMLQ